MWFAETITLTANTICLKNFILPQEMASGFFQKWAMVLHIWNCVVIFDYFAKAKLLKESARFRKIFLRQYLGIRKKVFVHLLQLNH